MVTYNDCDEILCINSNCFFCENGICNVAYNQLEQCVCPAEFIDVRIQVLDNYIKDIPSIIDKEYQDSELTATRNSKQFWETLRESY